MRFTLSKLVPLMAPAAAISLVSAACGDNYDERTATATPAAGSGVPTRQLSTPAASADGTASGEVETAARRLLADELEVDERRFKLDSSESVQRSDASLGCFKEGMFYAQVITPGYKLVFNLAGTSHAVHTNSDGSHLAICGDGQ